MPSVRPNETRSQYMARCVDYVMGEADTTGPAHAVAKCAGMWRQHAKRSQIANAKARNPGRIDPTRTGLLRLRFMRAVTKGFNQLKSAIIQLVVTEDAFGLKQRTRNPALVGNQRYMALTTPQQLAAFKVWLQAQIDAQVLQGVQTGANNWLEQYIREAYERGTGRSFDDYMRKHKDYYGTKQDYYQGTKDEFMRSAFRNPASVERVSLLASRAYTDLKGVTDAMSTQMNRVMTDGIIQGKSPRDLARELNKTVEGIGKRRAETIARTETIRAHADGQLDALKRLGVEEVGVMVEWSTASDDLVCDLCADMDGAVLKLIEASHIIPRHPNCRCAWLPANVGEDTKGQKRGADAKTAIDKSIKDEIPKSQEGKRTLADQRKRSRWAGADLKKVGAPLNSPITKVDKPTKAKTTKPKVEKPLKPVAPVIPEPTVGIPTTPEQVFAEFQKLSLENKLQHPLLDDLRKKFLEESAASELQLKELTSKWVDYNTAIHYETERFIALTEQIDKAGALPRNEYVVEVARLKAERQLISDKVDVIANELDRVKAQMDSIGASKQGIMERSLGLPLEERCKIQGHMPDLIVEYYDYDNKTWKKALDVSTRSEHHEASDRFLSALMSNRNGVREVNYTSHIMEDGERAFCKTSDAFKVKSHQGIYVTANESRGVITHEIGHELEAQVKDGHKLAKEFRDLRVARAGTPDVKLAEQFPGYNYRVDEIGNKDEFDKALSEASAYYVGKVYSYDASEVISMAVQALVESPVKLAEKDPEFFNFIIGYLRGVL